MKRKLLISLIIIIAGTVSFLFAQQLGKKWSGQRMAAIQEKRNQELLSHPYNREKLLEYKKSGEIIGMNLKELENKFGKPEVRTDATIRYQLQDGYTLRHENETYLYLNFKDSKVTNAYSRD
jgi:hypothetical protein